MSHRLDQGRTLRRVDATYNRFADDQQNTLRNHQCTVRPDKALLIALAGVFSSSSSAQVWSCTS